MTLTLRRRLIAALAAIALLVGLAVVATPEPASAHYRTGVVNAYTPTIYVSHNSRDIVPIWGSQYGGRSMGISHIVVQPWTCVYVEAYGRQYCAGASWYWVAASWWDYRRAWRTA